MAWVASRLVTVETVSSAASSPLLSATIARAVSSRVAVMFPSLRHSPQASRFGDERNGSPEERHRGCASNTRMADRRPPTAYLCFQSMIVLAGDIGGTNSRLALYESAANGTPRLLFERTYPSAAHASLDDIADAFLSAAETALEGRVGRSKGVSAACLAIAGPIENNICRATNLPWVVDGRSLAARLGIERLRLMNDFHAAAQGVTAVDAQWLAPLGG